MTITHGWRHALWIAPLTAVLGSGAAPALAQSTSADSAAIDEVVVTARKRSENLQDVPIAITAITTEQIAREGIKSVEGIIARDPSLNFDVGIAPYDTRIVIRGLSPTRGRPNVASLVDGIDVSSEAIGVAGGSLLINPRLIDIAQIEIVKGPQSALYGRSAFAGAISYTTQDPSKELSGGVGLDFNNRSSTSGTANISFPLTDTLGLRLNGYNFSDSGFYKNSTTGHDVGGGAGSGGALSLKWSPNDSYAAKFRAEYSDDRFAEPAQTAMPFNARNAVPASASICNVGTRTTGALAVAGIIQDAGCAVTPSVVALSLNAARELDRITGGAGRYDDMSIPAFRGAVGNARDQHLQVSFNRDYTRSLDNGVTAPEFTGSNRQVARFSVVQGFTTNLGTFNSLTGYTRALVSTDFDIDKTAYLPIQQTLKTDGTTEQFSQELRFNSDFKGPIQFVAGLQLWKERADQFDRNNTVIAEGTLCYAFDPPGPAPAIQSPPLSPPAVPFPVPFGSCTNPTGGFTSTSASPFLDDAAAARPASWTRRVVDHKSAYLELEWKIVDSLKFIAEARYIDEKNYVVGGFTNGMDGPGTVVLCGATVACRDGAGVTAVSTRAVATTRYIQYPTLNDKYTTPKATIQWSPWENGNFYASYSTGRKPGGYTTTTFGGSGAPSLANVSDIQFLPEKLKVYELGGKWTSTSRRLQINGAIFKQDFTDKQVSSQYLPEGGTVVSTRISNAGAAVLQGLELSAQWRASQKWSLGGGLTYFSKYEYTNYKTTSNGAGEIARVGNCTIGYLVGTSVTPLGNSPIPTNPLTNAAYPLTCILDRTGNQFEDTPKLALAANIGYRTPIGATGNMLFVDLDANWQDKRFLEDDNTAFINSYWLANLRVGLESKKWSVTAYVDNLSDDRTIRSAGSGPAIYASDFRFGFFINPVGSAAATRVIAAPSIPTTVFADLPSPRTIGLRFNYKF